MAIKKNLLEIVQNILSDMDSEEVNTISDTVEAMQVAQIVETTLPCLTPVFQHTSNTLLM